MASLGRRAFAQSSRNAAFNQGSRPVRSQPDSSAAFGQQRHSAAFSQRPAWWHLVNAVQPTAGRPGRASRTSARARLSFCQANVWQPICPFSAHGLQ
eukprot:706152-Lingulodinium_polyedra.AAC.1